jgi:hypothetical protein
VHQLGPTSLLGFDEPVSFIFSHSALREGWDNPNVFQICTMREIGSETERRQQVGSHADDLEEKTRRVEYQGVVVDEINYGSKFLRLHWL